MCLFSNKLPAGRSLRVVTAWTFQEAEQGMQRRSNNHLGCLTEPRFLILLGLSKDPRHGYGIKRDLEKGIGDSKIRLTTGTLYGGLRELTEMGWITVVPSDGKSGGRRPIKSYRLTADGRSALTRQVARMRWLLAAAERYGL